MRLVSLGREHRPLLEGFRCRSPELTFYLRRFALRHHERDRLSHTHLAIDGDRLVGWFSLAAASVERASVDEVADLSRLPGFPIPAILLARLAVDERATGQGVGRWLFEEALRIAIAIARSGPVGARLFVADAKDEAAVAFYRHLGLRQLSDSRRMIGDLDALGR